MSWKDFLRAQWEAIAAGDFFTAEVLTLRGLTRYYVLFVIELETRRVEIAGIIQQPHGESMMQVARNLPDPEDGFLTGKRDLILDRDPQEGKDVLRDVRVDGVNIDTIGNPRSGISTSRGRAPTPAPAPAPAPTPASTPTPTPATPLWVRGSDRADKCVPPDSARRSCSSAGVP